MNGRVINGDAALIHHLLKIPQAEIVSQIPPDAQQDHRAIEITAFEHQAPPERAGGVGRTELPEGLQQIQTASANMIDPEEKAVGTVTVKATPSGMLHVIIEMTDLPPGPHGFHIHETGQCTVEDGFESAGGHYAGDKEHGIESENGPH